MMFSYLKITRPLNTFIAAVSVFIAAFLSMNFRLSSELLPAMIVVWLITAGANVINDVFDIEIDRINRPSRVLPSGRITIGQARGYYFLLNGLALLVGLRLPLVMILIMLAAMTGLYFYSRYWKRMVLIGNFSVALISAATFLFGALAVNDIRAGIYPAIFAFFFHLGREIVKDMQDVKGDLESGAKTFAAYYGLTASRTLINLIFLVLICFLYVPFFQDMYNIYYIYVVTPGVTLVLAILSLMLWKSNTSHSLGLVSIALKIDMLIGLIAIYVGGKP